MKQSDCVYPDWEGGVIVDTHIYDKKDVCIICGDMKESEDV